MTVSGSFGKYVLVAYQEVTECWCSKGFTLHNFWMSPLGNTSAFRYAITIIEANIALASKAAFRRFTCWVDTVVSTITWCGFTSVDI